MKAEGLLAQASRADARGDRPRAARQPLPLHRLREGRSTRSSSPPPRSAARRCPRPTGAAASARASARYQGAELALGDRPFIGDMAVPGMLHGALRFSDHPRARVAPHRHLEGRGASGRRRASSTAADVPGERTQGSITRDWPQLVAAGRDDRVRRRRDRRRRRRDAARGPRARPRSSRSSTRCSSRSPTRSRRSTPARPMLHEGGNVLSVSRVQRGDADAALAGAAHVVSRRFRTQFIEHAFLEPESSLAAPRGRRAARLLAGPGHLGRPPPDRLVPRAARGAASA